MDECGKQLTSGPCKMEAGHKGRHSTVVFYCDACGKTRRGQPYQEDEDSAVCFMCVNEYRKARDLYGFGF